MHPAQIDQMRTLIELFEFSTQKFPDNPLLWEKPRDRYISSTYLEIRQQVYAFGAGLLTIGLKKEERVGLLSEGRNNWLVSELFAPLATVQSIIADYFRSHGRRAEEQVFSMAGKAAYGWVRREE